MSRIEIYSGTLEPTKITGQFMEKPASRVRLVNCDRIYGSGGRRTRTAKAARRAQITFNLFLLNGIMPELPEVETIRRI